MRAPGSDGVSRSLVDLNAVRVRYHLGLGRNFVSGHQILQGSARRKGPPPLRRVLAAPLFIAHGAIMRLSAALDTAASARSRGSPAGSGLKASPTCLAPKNREAPTSFRRRHRAKGAQLPPPGASPTGGGSFLWPGASGAARRFGEPETIQPSQINVNVLLCGSPVIEGERCRLARCATASTPIRPDRPR